MPAWCSGGRGETSADPGRRRGQPGRVGCFGVARGAEVCDAGGTGAVNAASWGPATRGTASSGADAAAAVYGRSTDAAIATHRPVCGGAAACLEGHWGSETLVSALSCDLCGGQTGIRAIARHNKRTLHTAATTATVDNHFPSGDRAWQRYPDSQFPASGTAGTQSQSSGRVGPAEQCSVLALHWAVAG